MRALRVSAERPDDAAYDVIRSVPHLTLPNRKGSPTVGLKFSDLSRIALTVADELPLPEVMV
jgi:hypothetical protein